MTILHDLCDEANTEKIQRNLRHASGGAHIHSMDNRGFFPLHALAKSGTAESLALLIEAGADINCKTGGFDEDRTPLMIAAIHGNLATLDYLYSLDNQGIHLEDEDTANALLLAIVSDQKQTADYLYKVGSRSDDRHLDRYLSRWNTLPPNDFQLATDAQPVDYMLKMALYSFRVYQSFKVGIGFLGMAYRAGDNTTQTLLRDACQRDEIKEVGSNAYFRPVDPDKSSDSRNLYMISKLESNSNSIVNALEDAAYLNHSQAIQDLTDDFSIGKNIIQSQFMGLVWLIKLYKEFPSISTKIQTNRLVRDLNISSDVIQIKDVIQIDIDQNVRDQINQEILKQLIYEIRKDGVVDDDEKEVFQRIYVMLKIPQEKYIKINQEVIEYFEEKKTEGCMDASRYLKRVEIILDAFYLSPVKQQTLDKIKEILGA